MTGWLGVEEAQARLLALANPLAPTRLPLVSAEGRYLAEPLMALRTQPAASLSAMDGFAVRFSDLPGPWRPTGEIAAGTVPDRALQSGEAARIFTGAPLPQGADTVVIQEDITADGAQVALTGTGPARAGEYVRMTGSDFSAGDVLAAPGTSVSAGLIALAAMAGHAELAVREVPLVAVITTGDELMPPGSLLEPGQIPDSNGVMLAALLRRWPAVVGTVQRIGDDRDVTVAALKQTAATHDVVVTVGGASVGAHDHIHAALTSLGAPPAFWKVAMRPGKPVLAARCGRAVVLGLPGNPASAFVTAQLLLLPLLRHLAGAADPLPHPVRAPLASGLGPGGARREYLRARLAGGALHPWAEQDSGLVSALANANALIIREAGAEACAPGAQALYLPI